MIVDDFVNGFKGIFNPNKTTQKKMDIGQALGMYYKFSVIPVILFIVIGAIVALAAGALLSSIPGLSSFGAAGGALAIVGVIVGAILEFWIFIPIGIFISAALYHVVGAALGWFKQGYSATLTSTVYYMMTVVAVAWLLPVPILGALLVGIFSIWGIYVFITALANQHKTTKGKAFVVWLIWVIIGIVIFAILGMGALFAMGGLSHIASSSSYNTTGGI
ncbi:MAG: hypothetical protein M1504_02475 [Candidatus Marsarchaeota archaeon]|nr:hypothetical protein [Candidatus Marsarchaeota archaeon]